MKYKVIINAGSKISFAEAIYEAIEELKRLQNSSAWMDMVKNRNISGYSHTGENVDNYVCMSFTDSNVLFTEDSGSLIYSYRMVCQNDEQ